MVDEYLPSALQTLHDNKRSVLALVLAQPIALPQVHCFDIHCAIFVGLTSLLQGVPSVAATSLPEESKECTGTVIGEAREGAETLGAMRAAEMTSSRLAQQQ